VFGSLENIHASFTGVIRYSPMKEGNPMASSRSAATAVVAAMMILRSGCVFAKSAGPCLCQAELHRLLRIAHSSGDFQTLSAYYRCEQARFKLEAMTEGEEWTRRESVGAALFLKYPRPEDSAHYRHDYFFQEAKEMERNAEHFEMLAATSPQ
jgi:hypothetical protein